MVHPTLKLGSDTKQPNELSIEKSLKEFVPFLRDFVDNSILLNLDIILSNFLLTSVYFWVHSGGLVGLAKHQLMPLCMHDLLPRTRITESMVCFTIFHDSTVHSECCSNLNIYVASQTYIGGWLV